MKLFSTVISSQNRIGQIYILNGYGFADSEEEMMGILIKQGKDEFPTEKGWGFPHVIAAEIPISEEEVERIRNERLL